MSSLINSGPASKAALFPSLKFFGRSRQVQLQTAMRLKILLDSTSEAICGTDDEGRCTFANAAMGRLFGYHTEELIGSDMHALLHHSREDGSGYPASECPIRRSLGSGRVCRIVTEVMWHRDGTRIPVEYSSFPCHDGLTTRGVLVTIVDRTERERAERALRESESRYRALFESADDAIFLIKDKVFVDCNPRALEMFRCQRSDIVGRTPVELSPSQQPDGTVSATKAQATLRAACSNGPALVEWKCRRLDGSLFDADVSVSRLEVGGEPMVMGVVRDVTDRKRTEEARGRLAAIVESSEDAMISVGLDGTVSSWNAGAERLYGYTADEMIGRPISRIMPPDRRELEEVYRRITVGERIEHYETERMRKDGSRITISLAASPIHDRAGTIVGIAAVARDITERKAAEQALREREKLLDGLFNASPAGVAILDRRLRYVRVNERLAEMNGFSVADHLGRQVSEMVPSVASLLEPILCQVFETGEAVLNREVRGETSGAPGIIRDWTTSCFPIPGIDGRPVALGFLATEVTELRRALAKAEESHRLKDAFLANMSHEIRTPLNVILGYDSLLAEHLAALGDHTQDDLLKGVWAASKRLIDTVHGILDLSRMETGIFEIRPEPIKIAQLLARHVDDVRQAVRDKGLQLDVAIEEAGAIVTFDEYCLSHSLSRLLDNAVKFTAVGSIRVRLYRDLDSVLALSIADTGVGMDPDYVRRAFEPFSQEQIGYTRSYEGTGLGLPLTYRYIARNGATISIESTKGRGSVFTIRFCDPPSTM